MTVSESKVNELHPLVRDVKNILYLDGNDDDELLNSYVIAADSFIKNAIGSDVNGFYDDSHVKSLINLAVKSLAATYYQNRLSLSNVQSYPVDLTVNSIIGQLRGLYSSFTEGSDGNGK